MRRSSRGRRCLLLAAALAVEPVAMKLRGFPLGGRLIVRCRQGHLFTTIWIPGVKLKAIDLGIARVQRCPVGRHWSLVTPVREATLTDAELRSAREHHDVLVP